MKYEIKFACGHTCKIDLFGKREKRKFENSGKKSQGRNAVLDWLRKTSLMG